MASKHRDKKPLVKKLRSKYRLVILNDDTFEEKLSLKLSRLNVFLVAGFSGIFLIALTTLLIAFTPLREYIPGYSSTALKRQAYKLSQVTDSLAHQMEYNKRYLLNIQNIVRGEPPVNFSDTALTDSVVEAELQHSISREDSMLRRYVEEEERFSIGSHNSTKDKAQVLNFFPPLKGLITQQFNPEEDHLGLDIVSEENAVIKNAQDGVVIFSEWTAETGYVIIVQHSQNFITVYKHNSALLKGQGEVVRSGEPIAVLGNTGTYSSGPHLHFELWYDGFPVNPQDYVSF